MPKTRIIIVLGVLIALLPALGFPRSWEVFFQIFAGLAIVVLSVWATIDKKLTLKAKAQQRLAKKSLEATAVPPQAQGAVPPVTHTYGKRVTDFYPRTAPPGRRISDIKPTLEPSREDTSTDEDNI